jgi:hypothetical protein
MEYLTGEDGSQENNRIQKSILKSKKSKALNDFSVAKFKLFSLSKIRGKTVEFDRFARRFYLVEIQIIAQILKQPIKKEHFSNCFLIGWILKKKMMQHSKGTST